MLVYDKITKRIDWICGRYRDYNYLRNNINQGGRKKRIFVGSSYTLFGIIPSHENVVLALQSQDIYYSYKILQKYLSVNKTESIEVYLGLGYYALYHDLSSTKSYDENNRIVDIYYPLLHDFHNMPVERYNNACSRISFIDRCIKSIYCICTKFEKNTYGYFDADITRESKSRKTWKDLSKEWVDLSDLEKQEAAVNRALSHEKLLKYCDTCTENKTIIKNIQKLCRDYNCKLTVFIAPMSKQYLMAMSDNYKEKSRELIRFLKYENISFFDFNSSGGFENQDFVDSDHLSLSGATKLSAMIEYIQGGESYNYEDRIFLQK